MADFHTEQFLKAQAKKYNLPLPTVRYVSNFPFRVTREVIEDPDNTADILLHKFCRFTLKKKFKDNKQMTYKKYIQTVREELIEKGLTPRTDEDSSIL